MRFADFIQRVLASGLLLLTACPSGNTPEGNGGTDSPISNAERMASLDTIEKLIEPFELNGDPAVNDQIAAVLSGMPEFAEVKVYGGSVTARFTDGEILVVINTQPPDLPAQQQASVKSIVSNRAIGAPSPLTQSIFRSPGAARAAALPKSKKALLVNAMGTAYKDDTPDFQAWFTGAGYQASLSDGSVESFRNDVTDIGVLYVSSHGAVLKNSWIPGVNKEVLEGVAETPRPTAPLADSDGRDHFIIWTRTVITNETIEKYRKEVTTGRMTYCIADNNRGADGKITQGRHFGITEAFIYDHWKCQPGALIYMDCCWAATGSLPDICFSSHVNATAYLGWTAPTFIQYASMTARYFFDRTLGANQYTPPSPPGRAFPVGTVYSSMETKNRRSLDPVPDLPPPRDLDLPLHRSETSATVMLKDGLTFAELELFLLPPADDELLVPGILNVKAGSNILTISGTFGDEAGTVTVGGTVCPVRSDGWRNNQILCDLPSSGPGSSGPVVVTAEERQSNPRALTQWNLTLHRLFMDYPTQGTTDCPSCFYEATLHYTFRADPGGARLVVDGPSLPSNYIGGADQGSIDVTNAGGSFLIGQGSTITLAPNPDDGAAFIGTCLGFAPPEDNNYLGACFFLKGDESVIAFSPTILAEGLFRIYTGGAYDGIVDPYQVVYYGNPIGSELILTYSPNFTIEAGQQPTGPNSYFQWDAAEAHSPPDSNDPK